MNIVKRFSSDSSAVSLLVSNVLTIILALVQRWDVATVLWVYWAQSVIIGLFNFFRMLSLETFSTENFVVNDQPVLPNQQTKISTAFFFVFHYGFFHFGYAIFLFSFFKASSTVDVRDIVTGGLIFFFNHLYSFYRNRINDKQQIQNIGRMMFAPYARIVPMHLIIVFGALLGPSTLIIFLLLKTLVDLVLHAIKHQTNYSLILTKR